jgi:ZIP family zinc transporter
MSLEHPALQALIATMFTWAVTALGAATVFLFRDVPQKVFDSMLGFAGGVMLAASYWSLLAPAIEMARHTWAGRAWLPAAIGFVGGGLALLAVDNVLPHLHVGRRREKAEGLETSWRRAVLLVLAITLHNIPEGLAVGVAFGAAALELPGATIGAAVALAIGIGLQNFPEGVAVSVPLRREGTSRIESFWYGQLSAAVEPVAGVIGAVAVWAAQPVLPFALSFAAGAMVYVVVEEVVPEAQRSGHTDLTTTGLIAGFTVMMILDVALG